VNVTGVLPNGKGAKIDTVTAMLDNAVEDYGFARDRNLFVPTDAEHVPGYMSVMKNFLIRRVSLIFEINIYLILIINIIKINIIS
jgi:hypothetical protein